MTTAATDRQYYAVRLGRYLYWADPSAPGVDKRGNLWARPGEFVEASHPVLQTIISTQRHKVRALKPGDTIPEGSILHTEVTAPLVVGRIRAFDGKLQKGSPVTPAEIVVQGAGEAASGDAPKLAADPVKTAKAKAKKESGK